MPKLFAVTILAFVAGTSAALATAPASGPLAADALTVILPGARADAEAILVSRHGPRAPEPAVTQEDVVITGGPGSKPPSTAPAGPANRK